ncbi:MAG: yellow, partial [Armatimonadetes bacterium]|nr:yellow [Armatimonadota bacterium]
MNVPKSSLTVVAVALNVTALVTPAFAQAPQKPVLKEPFAAGGRRDPRVEIVHRFTGIMPVGVAVTKTGRVFATYPRWADVGAVTLAEIVNGKEVPYPLGGEFQSGHKTDPGENLVSLQGLRLDSKDRLWVLDTGTLQMKPVTPFTPKLVCINTTTNAVEKIILLPKEIAPEGTYLNDLRIDEKRGTGEGIAYITDSGETSGNGIICVDLKTNEAWRRLKNHPSVLAEPGFVGKPETGALYKRPKPGVKQPVKIGSDGIAISPSGDYLYYKPLASRRLYRVPTAALVDTNIPDDDVATKVENLGVVGVTDGMEEDTRGRIYLTDWERRAITRRETTGKMTTVVQDDRLLWLDTLD